MTINSTLAFIVKETSITEKPHSYYRDNSDSLRRNMLHQEKPRLERQPRFLLVDDDPILCRIMQKAAQSLGIELTYLSTLDDLSKLTETRFDVAMLDYDLGFLNGYEVASYLEQKVPEMPIILISHLNNLSTNQWAGSIREFIHKKLGPFAILDAAVEAYEVMMFHKNQRSSQTLQRQTPKPRAKIVLGKSAFVTIQRRAISSDLAGTMKEALRHFEKHCLFHYLGRRSDGVQDHRKDYWHAYARLRQ